MQNDTRISVDLAKAVFEVAVSDRPGEGEQAAEDPQAPMNGSACCCDERCLREKQEEPRDRYNGVRRYQRRKWQLHVPGGRVDDRRAKRDAIEEDHQKGDAHVEATVEPADRSHLRAPFLWSVEPRG